MLGVPPTGAFQRNLRVWKMEKVFTFFFGLDRKRTIWIDQDDLGKEKIIRIKNKLCAVRIPEKIHRYVILRLRGFGKTRGDKSGDLFLHVWLNKGEDVGGILWLSDTCARKGAEKVLKLQDRKMMLVIPPHCSDNSTLRFKGFGTKMDFTWRAPFLNRNSGNVLLKLCIFPEFIASNYGTFDALSTESMALEGWVYRTIDQLSKTVGMSFFNVDPIPAERIADNYNENGWIGIFDQLVEHFRLSRVDLQVTPSDLKSKPGSCMRTTDAQVNKRATHSYRISINQGFLDNPFAIAAILAHELCHVVFSENISWRGISFEYGTASIDEERSVDLLVFLFKLGEFQLRIARDSRLTLGYFNQEIFERMQVIVSRKLRSI